MEGSNLLKGKYRDDPELQQRDDEGISEYLDRIDGIMTVRQNTKKQISIAKLSGFLGFKPDEAGYQVPERDPARTGEQIHAQVREEASGLLEIRGITI